MKDNNNNQFQIMEPSTAAAAGFGHLFSWRHPATLDLNHAAYRYNQNMMEYYTCKSKFRIKEFSNSVAVELFQFFLIFVPVKMSKKYLDFVHNVFWSEKIYILYSWK